MGSYTLSTYMALRKIDENETAWFNDWLINFGLIDAHDHSSGKGTQIAAGGIADGAITNAKVNAAAAIAGTKISPDFGTQNIITSGDLRIKDAASADYVGISAPVDVTASYNITFPGAVSTADDLMLLDGSGVVTFDKIVNANVKAGAAIVYSKLSLTDSILNADINSAASIAYSKLNLSDSLLNADINSAAAIAYSKLDLAGSILNADVNIAAAIAYSKLNLSNSILNADVNAAAAIAGSKITPTFGAQSISSSVEINVPSVTVDTSDLIIDTTTSGDVELNPISTIARIMGATANNSGIKYLLFGSEAALGGDEAGIRVNSSGVLQYKDRTGSWTGIASAASANPALDNLVSVAINTSLISDTDNTDDLGSDAIEWKDIWVHSIKHNDAVDSDLSISTEGNDGSILMATNGTGVVDITAPVDITGDLDVDNININGNTIKSTDSNGNVIIEADGTGKILNNSISRTVREDVAVYNNSGGALAAYKVVKITGDYATDEIPEVNVVSSLEDKVIGIVPAEISDTSTGDIVKRGRLVVTGFDCSGATIEDPVYCDASGDLTLTETDIQVGQVVDNASDGIIYVNIGAGGSGSGLIDGTDARLGVETIDGSSNAVDTEIDVYSPSTGYAYGLKIVISNFNTSEVAKVRVANRDGSIADDDYLVYDISIAPKSRPIVLELSGMSSSETITVRSDVVDVNFAVYGEEAASDKKASCLGRYEVSSVDTDEDAITFTEENQVDIVICNRSASETATVTMKLADTATEADEDIIYPSVDILPNQTEVVGLDLNVAADYKLVVNSSEGDVNFQIYSRGNTQFVTSAYLPADVQLKQAREFGQFDMSANQSSDLSANNPVKFDTVVTNQGVVTTPSSSEFTLKKNKSYLLFGSIYPEFSGSSGAIEFQWYDKTNSAYLGLRGSKYPIAASVDYDGQNDATAFVNPDTDIDIELRIRANTNCTTIYKNYSYANILEIGNLVDYVKNPYQVDYYVNNSRVVTGTNWTTDYVEFLDYKDPSGNWRTRFNIAGSFSSGSANTFTVTIAALTFKTAVAGFDPSISIYDNNIGARASGSWWQAIVNRGASTITASCPSTISIANKFKFSGDVALASKPSDI